MAKLGTQKDIINIEGERNFVRDKNSKAILSNNSEGLRAYKLKRIQIMRKMELERLLSQLIYKKKTLN